MPSLVLVSDLDHSLIPEDSERRVAVALGREAEYHAAAKRYGAHLLAAKEGGGGRGDAACSWPRFMADVFGPFAIREIHAAAASAVAMEPSVARLLRDVVLMRDGRPRHASDGRCTLDAVDFFVVSGSHSAIVPGILQEHLGGELFELLERRIGDLWLHSHRAVAVDPQLHPEAHAKGYKTVIQDHFASPATDYACTRCQGGYDAGMCKGTVLDTILSQLAAKAADATVVYIGDGGNDLCVLSRLRARDVFFAREGFALSKYLTGVRRDEAAFSRPTAHTRQDHGVCTVVPWASYDDELVPGIEYMLYGGAEFQAALIAQKRKKNSNNSTTNGAGNIRGDDGRSGSLDAIATRFPRVAERLRCARRVLESPLMLFADDAESFRGVTVTHRMPETVLHTLAAHGPDVDPVVSKRVKELAAAIASQPCNPLLPPCRLQPLSIDAPSSAPTADTHERESFWLPALRTAVEASMFPGPIAAYAAGGQLSAAASASLDARLLDGTLTWNDLPWLHGEILLHRLLPIVYASGSSTSSTTTCDVGGGSGGEPMISPDALERTTAGDRCVHCASAQGGGSVATPCGGCAYSRDGHRAVAAPAWDFYRFEKAESLRTTLASHIVPAAGALFTELTAVEAAVTSAAAETAAGGGRPTDALRGRVERLLHAMLLNCLWGNCVDLSLHRSSDVAASAGTSASAASSSSSSAVLSFDETYARLVGKSGLLADHTPAVARRLAAAIFLSGGRGDTAGGPSPVVLTNAHQTADTGAATANQRLASQPRALDIVVDNAGVEVSADLLLATGVAALANAASPAIRGGCAVRVAIQCKALPFYVSDVVPHDVGLALGALRDSGAPAAAAFAERCSSLFDARAIVLRPSPLMCAAREWREHGSELFERFFVRGRRAAENAGGDPDALGNPAVVPKTAVVICKGDLNFRRVIGDRRWNDADAADWTEAAGSFWPPAHDDDDDDNTDGTPSISLCVLRTCKCELVCGPSIETVAKLDAEHAVTRPDGVPRTTLLGDAPAAVRTWVKASWRVRGKEAVALVYPTPREEPEAAP